MRGRARAASTRSSRCASGGSSTRRAIGEVTETRRLRVFDGDALVGDMPVTALVDECPVYDLAPVAPSVPMYPAPAGARSPADPGGDAARAARLRQPRLAALGVRAVRLHRRLAHGAPAGAGRRRGAAGCRRRRRDRGLDRRQRPARGVRPLPRRGRGGARVQREPRLRRRRAARPHQLPQLRQPGEAARGLAALARGGGAAPTPAARSASRSSAATSRSTTRAPGARSSRPRSWGWSASCPKAGAVRPPRLRGGGRRRRDHLRGLVGAVGDRLRAGEAARRGALGRAPARRPRRAEALHAAVREAVRAGALRSAHDVAEGGLAVALAEGCLAGGLGATVDLSPLRPAGEALLFGEGPGAFVVSGPEQSLRRLRRRGDADRHGGRSTSGHHRRAGGPVRDLATAHESGLASLLHDETWRSGPREVVGGHIARAGTSRCGVTIRLGPPQGVVHIGVGLPPRPPGALPRPAARGRRTRGRSRRRRAAR